MSGSHVPARRHAVALADGASEVVFFSWNEAAGLAPAADLWVESNGRTLLQVTSEGAHPFARAGLEVASLHPRETYRLSMKRVGDSIHLDLLTARGDPVLVETGLLAAGSDGPDVFLPPMLFRHSITSSLQ
jgi:hypothetical protein